MTFTLTAQTFTHTLISRDRLGPLHAHFMVSPPAHDSHLHTHNLSSPSRLGTLHTDKQLSKHIPGAGLCFESGLVWHSRDYPTSPSPTSSILISWHHKAEPVSSVYIFNKVRETEAWNIQKQTEVELMWWNEFKSRLTECSPVKQKQLLTIKKKVYWRIYTL